MKMERAIENGFSFKQEKSKANKSTEATTESPSKSPIEVLNDMRIA